MSCMRCIVIMALTCASFCQHSAQAQPAPIEIREAMAIGRVANGGRVAVPVDAIADLIARDKFQLPKAGDRVESSAGSSSQWVEVKAGADGVFQDRALAGGYLACKVEMPQPAVMLLEVSGGAMAYVNGEPRAGDPYSYGYLRLPVALHQGTNSLLIAAGRGRVKVRLLPAKAPASIDVTDATLPDLLLTDRGTLLAGIVVTNASDQALKDLRFAATTGDGEAEEVSAVPLIPPMTIRKVPVPFRVPAQATGEKISVKLELRRTAENGKAAPIDSATISIRVRKTTQEYRRTFISGIDGSVQYYAINPAQKPADTNVLALTLHGASVEAQGQADAYGPHDEVTLVAPTNRRPYGFDWEDLGRLDALEVLELAEKTIPHDPHRVVLTGHSMGGHGTWQVGLTHPDRFAAIGPSAGWSSFASYGGGQRPTTSASGIQQILSRANSPSDTLSLARNSLMQEIYILHGSADDNVPVREARMMRAALEKFHPRLSYHEEPGAGHWWGAKCVDWPPMFSMFETVRLPADKDVAEIEFTTADPAVSGRCHWATIHQQIEPMQLSTIKLHRKDDLVSGTTENVAMISLDAVVSAATRRVELDGDTVDLPSHSPGDPAYVVLQRQDGHWKTIPRLDPRQKNAARGGPFKLALAGHMIFVYGTHGDEAENAAAYHSARFLAESFYYRGNGAVDIVADRAFDAEATRERNVILFGNADVNNAWPRVLEKCPIDVRRNRVTVGERRFDGSDLSGVFVYPRSGSDAALVGVVFGTGIAGMKTADRLPLLVSGAALPDWIVLGEKSQRNGIAGVRGAGFFSNDWAMAADQSFFAVPPHP